MNKYYETAIAFAIYPFAIVAIVWFTAKIKVWIVKYMPNGWLKHHLLRERWNSCASDSTRRITGGQEFR